MNKDEIISRAIGEEVVFDGHTYMVCKSEGLWSCTKCSLWPRCLNLTDKERHLFGRCMSFDRPDGESVVFVETGEICEIA